MKSGSEFRSAILILCILSCRNYYVGLKFFECTKNGKGLVLFYYSTKYSCLITLHYITFNLLLIRGDKS